MKNTFSHSSLILAGISFLFFPACKKDAPNRAPDPTPIVVTTAISSITGSGAKSGGTVSFPGGTGISSRGVCWGTAKNPTTGNSKTTDSSGIGSFTSKITGLTSNTSYYVRAYAVYSLGTVYGNELTFTTSGYVPGDEYQGGIIAYILQAGDSGYVAGGFHGLIAAPTDQSAGSAWGCDLTAINGADRTALGSGNQNTLDILAGCATLGIAARLCSNLIIGTYTDWYLPSKEELNKLYLNKAAIGGFTQNPYWSSSESDAAFAWASYFNNGSQSVNSKNATNYVRAVRSF